MPPIEFGKDFIIKRRDAKFDNSYPVRFENIDNFIVQRNRFCGNPEVCNPVSVLFKTRKKLPQLIGFYAEDVAAEKTNFIRPFMSAQCFRYDSISDRYL